MTSCTECRPAAVLVVDDEVLVRMVIADMLTDEGYRVVEARDAQEALTLLQARTDVQAIITDVHMPGEIDGLTLAHLVHRRWPEIGVVITSGKLRPQPGDLPRGARFLAKPYMYSALLQVLVDLLPQEEAAVSAVPVLPAGIVVQPPVTGAGNAVGVAAPLPEPDKS